MIRVLLLMPSTFGAFTFSIAYALYTVNLIGYERSTMELNLVCMTTVLAYFVASATSLRAYTRFAHQLDDVRSCQDAAQTTSSPISIAFLHAIGLIGIGQYVNNLISFFGSPGALAIKLATSSYEVRLASEYTASIGTQLSYLGWLAIWFTILKVESGRGRLILVVLSIIQFCANLIYIDRTRPMWILFVGALLLMLKKYSRLTSRSIVRLSVTATISTVALFLAIGLWVGKINTVGGEASIGEQSEAIFEPMYMYATSGFAYLNRVIIEEVPAQELDRSLYPMFILLSRLGASDPPPSQVNDFILVPMPTNVGTFLEPLYRDGGSILMIAGILIHAFFFNWVGLQLLRGSTSASLVAWGVLCFVSAIAFFTPKYNNTPTWLFLILGVLSLLRLKGNRRRILLQAIDL